MTFSRPGTSWDVPASGWHLDSRDLELTMLAVFAHLAPVRPRGGGTLVITGSHRLTTPKGPQAANAPVRSHEVKASLSTVHPWLFRDDGSPAGSSSSGQPTDGFSHPGASGSSSSLQDIKSRTGVGGNPSLWSWTVIDYDW